MAACDDSVPPYREADAWEASRSRAERARNVADVLRHQITIGAFDNGLLPDERTLSRQLAATPTRSAMRSGFSAPRG